MTASFDISEIKDVNYLDVRKCEPLYKKNKRMLRYKHTREYYHSPHKVYLLSLCFFVSSHLLRLTTIWSPARKYIYFPLQEIGESYR